MSVVYILPPWLISSCQGDSTQESWEEMASGTLIYYFYCPDTIDLSNYKSIDNNKM